MKKYFLLMLWVVPLNLLAQQPQWELFFPDQRGPIAVDPTDSDIIYIAGDSCNNCAKIGMWKTTDGGQTWNFYDEGWGMGRPADILIDPDNPQEILVSGGPFVGVLKSTDGGQTWIRADYGFIVDHHGYRIQDLAFDSQRRVFYAADEGGGAFCGVFSSTDGLNWQELTTRFCALKVIVDELSGDIYAGAVAAGVWKSTDAGSAWVYKSKGLTVNPQTVYDLVKLEKSETLYAATFRGIYKTVDGGENWVSANAPLTGTLSFRAGLVVADADTNTIFAGALAKSVLDSIIVGGIYISRNGGDSWEQYHSGLPDTVLDFTTGHLFFDNRTNSLFAQIALLFGNSRLEKNHIYRLPNAIVTDVSTHSEQLTPTGFDLKVYPNPFNAQTTLVYTVPIKNQLTVQIFNIMGKEVMRLLDETVYPGEYRIHWDGTNRKGCQVPSGIYLIRVRLGINVKTIKLLMLK